MPEVFYVYHPTTCPQCGQDLTKMESVVVDFCIADHVFTRRSHVEENGLLSDIDNAVLNGYHAGSRCRHCDEQLSELDPPQN